LRAGWIEIVLLLGLSSGALAADDIPSSGRSGPETAAVDRVITDLMKQYAVPGGAVAVARDGKLVIARGYGYADSEIRRPVLPGTPFRLASLTKPITAMTALALGDRERLALELPVAPVLRGIVPTPVPPAQGTFSKLTIRHLLQHTGSWGPAGRDVDAAALRAALGREFQNDLDWFAAAWKLAPRDVPGTKFEYSTFGYCALSAIIEAIEQRPIEVTWQELLFGPVGARFRLAAATAAGEEAAPDEPGYYDVPGSPTVARQTPSGARSFSRPDAYWEPRKVGSCVGAGRLVASAADYLKVMLSAGDRRRPEIISRRSRDLLFDPHPVLMTNATQRYTHGLFVNADGNWVHTGGYHGTATMYSRGSRVDLVVLFNLRPQSDAFYNDIYSGIWRSIGTIDKWPKRDLFE
jgi:N-acyl-D-amino-acid deacylase